MMKKQTIKKCWLPVLCLGLAACSQNPSSPDRYGHIDHLIWPVPENVTFDDRQGTYPSPEAVALLRPGMTKDQIYALLGRPHFAEGVFRVREWDYLFHFRTGEEAVTTCQFKVIFNSHFISQGNYWKPVFPAGAGCPPSLQHKPAASGTRIELSADLLFGFDSAILRDDDVESAKVLDELVTRLRSLSARHTLLIEGYSDRLGSPEYNQALSAARANAVRNHLVALGVAAESVYAEGRGKYVPGTPCEHDMGAALKACLSPDRKVVITVETP
ncbi:outer membrane protein assembly factor BamE [Salmonella enterica]|nr:outer membrane protein assembly factor BamE [Salmonella enterica]EDR5596538.1 outer membrane protein assembly factor BamE [Salmonella enterica subsp. diarizonae]EDU6311634.1 outer membrane protein assembly factor BamE [Salmonella enterica subsp. diarizonae serovar 53:z10:z]EBK3635506.1 outer membrane protein assembly factor BamE [Salmonella enterica]EGW0492792.1 outer membrane protein assembly factor BamE [Salmonella enterica]